MSNTILQWGILGTAKIARTTLIPALQATPMANVLAVASREAQKATQFAAQNNIPLSYTGYQQVLDNPDIDAVYIPLPNHLHTPWALKAIAAGKHVLCEKPISLTAAQAKKLISFANEHPSIKVMEAFMYRFHPQWEKVRTLLQNNIIGNINNIDAVFTYYNRDPSNVRNQAGIGGGGLMDIGCYCISACRYLFNSEPSQVFGHLIHDEEFGTDKQANALLKFDHQGLQNANGSIFCSTQSEPSQRVYISGEKGAILMESPFYQLENAPAKVIIYHDRKEEVIEFAPCNQYVNQIEQFSKAIIENKQVPTRLSDALANMHVIDKIVASHDRQCWINNDTRGLS